MVWDHLNIDKSHVAYAVVAVFTAFFSLTSLVIKEKLYIGESTFASIYGLIVGPHCLGWFDPTSWGNSDYITLELSRITLVVQIFAVAVELPKKYMLRHWRSVFFLLVPVMTAGWLIVGAFVYILIPGLNFADSLLVSACITATDPVLAAAVVGKGKFAQRVPGHLRNILSAESGCNDGMAFPFIYLSLNLIVHRGNAGEIVKDWICITILYECIFGCILGTVIGYCGRHAIKFAERKNLIDRESFLAFYIVLALMSAGFGSMLGVDDLLVSFAAGAAFSWDGWFAKKTEASNFSTVIDLLINMAYFVYFGAIIPWEQFNNDAIGTAAWRLVILAIVVIFLRRIPAVLALKPFIPDIKSWREALFCGHFGPIGVGAVFAAILARGELESFDTNEATPLRQIPPPGSANYQLIACIWPIVTFLIITSIIVHGSSVAVLTLGRHLNSIAVTMTFTNTNTNFTINTSAEKNWLNRLPKLESSGKSFSLQRVDTKALKLKKNKKQKRKHKFEEEEDVLGKLAAANTLQNNEMQKVNNVVVETSGIKYRPAGTTGYKSKLSLRKQRRKQRRSMFQQSEADEEKSGDEPRRAPPQAEQFNLSQLHQDRLRKYREMNPEEEEEKEEEKQLKIEKAEPVNEESLKEETERAQNESENGDMENEIGLETSEPIDVSIHYETSPTGSAVGVAKKVAQPIKAYEEGSKVIIEDRHGEVIDDIDVYSPNRDSQVKSDNEDNSRLHEGKADAEVKNVISRVASRVSSITSAGSLKKSRPHRKGLVYRIGNNLVVENEDGEVIRRYEIHEHHRSKLSDTSEPKGKEEVKNEGDDDKDYVDVFSVNDNASPSLVNKTLNVIGLKKFRSNTAKAAETNKEEVSESELEETKGPHIQRNRSLPPETKKDYYDAYDDTDDNNDDDDDEDEEDDEDDAEEETEVERKRRLAALGHSANSPRDESDEEHI